MRSDLLHVFTARFNPMRWRTPHEHYLRWAQHMKDSGVVLHVAELTYGDMPHVCDVDGAIHHHFNASTPAWTKENLINLAMWQAPEAKYLAVIDSDVFFRNPDWAAETVRQLQMNHVVQPWKTALDLGPNGELLQTHTSFCHRLMQGGPVVPHGERWWKSDGGPYEYPHSGYAWAYTREFLNHVGGLIEIGGMGSGDHHMALALAGQVHRSWPGGTTESYKQTLLTWQGRAQRMAGSRVGIVHGMIEHAFHGTKPSRQYNGRWDMFLRHKFDPMHDLKRNLFGVLEWAGNKPELEREWRLYLEARQEDVNAA